MTVDSEILGMFDFHTLWRRSEVGDNFRTTQQSVVSEFDGRVSVSPASISSPVCLM